MNLRRRGYRLGREGKYFPERLERRRRFSVAVRPTVRRARWLERAAIALIVALSLTAVAVVRRFPAARLRPQLAGSLLPRAFQVDHVGFDGAVPEARNILARRMELKPASWGPWKPYQEARRLLREFPFLSSATARRDWKSRSIRFEVALRKPAARVLRRGKPWGWLSDDGTLFEAPAAFFPAAELPEIDLGGVSDADGSALARFLRETEATDAFTGKIARIELVSPEQGWKLVLSDGGKIFWGELRWTTEKLDRLKQVLGDARATGRAGWTPDLRYFGEGRILLKPRSS